MEHQTQASKPPKAKAKANQKQNPQSCLKVGKDTHVSDCHTTEHAQDLPNPHLKCANWKDVQGSQPKNPWQHQTKAGKSSSTSDGRGKAMHAFRQIRPHADM